MKTILAIALASVCFCATAHAATMPKQFLGEWCYDPGLYGERQLLSAR